MSRSSVMVELVSGYQYHEFSVFGAT